MNNIPFLKAHHVRLLLKLLRSEGIDVVLNKNILGRV